VVYCRERAERLERERDVKKMNDVRPNSGDSTKKSNNNLTELYQH